jgi:hypothetical protein
VGLIDDARAAQRASNGTRCTVSKVREAMPEEDRAEYDEALNDPTIPATILSRVLRDRGYEISGQPIARHRKGVCGCARG